jgi:hypothetical protein
MNLNATPTPAIFGYKYEQTEISAGIERGHLTLNEASGIAFGPDYTDLDIDVIQETQDRTNTY